MNPKDYTLEEWAKLWQEAHESDSVPTTPEPPYIIRVIVEPARPNPFSKPPYPMTSETFKYEGEPPLVWY